MKAAFQKKVKNKIIQLQNDIPPLAAFLSPTRSRSKRSWFFIFPSPFFRAVQFYPARKKPGPLHPRRRRKTPPPGIKRVRQSMQETCPDREMPPAQAQRISPANIASAGDPHGVNGDTGTRVPARNEQNTGRTRQKKTGDLGKKNTGRPRRKKRPGDPGEKKVLRRFLTGKMGDNRDKPMR